MATASSSTPNTALTASIQAPARGNSLPAEVPMASSGAPMPNPSPSSAKKPSTASPVWPMKISAPISGGATQGPTMSADSAPMMAAPTSVPPSCLLLISVSLV